MCLKVKAKYRVLFFFFLNQNPEKCPYLFPFRLTVRSHGFEKSTFPPSSPTDSSLGPIMGLARPQASPSPCSSLGMGSATISLPTTLQGICCRLLVERTPPPPCILDEIYFFLFFFLKSPNSPSPNPSPP